jgi:hypothetical protein
MRNLDLDAESNRCTRPRQHPTLHWTTQRIGRTYNEMLSPQLPVDERIVKRVIQCLDKGCELACLCTTQFCMNAGSFPVCTHTMPCKLTSTAIKYFLSKSQVVVHLQPVPEIGLAHNTACAVTKQAGTTQHNVACHSQGTRCMP